MPNYRIANDEANCAIPPAPIMDMPVSEILAQIYEMARCNRELATKACETMFGPSERVNEDKPNINSAFIHLMAIKEQLACSNDILMYINNRM